MRVGAIWVLVWSSAAAAADPGWHYIIGRAQQEQQANFCASREGAEEIAGIFNRFGAMAGYAALAGSPDCAIAVRSFTPRELLTSVTISEGEPGEYEVRFVEVEDLHGESLYLVTTREVVTE